MKAIIKISIMLLVLGISLNAQKLSGIPAAFVDVGYGARPMAMGGAYVGLANDVNSVVWNPAGLANLNNYQVSFSYFKQMQLINYQYFSSAIPLSRNYNQTLGFGLITNGDEALREWTVYASYARKISVFLVGVSLKLRYASFGNNKLNESDYVLFESDEIAEGIQNQVRGKALGFGFDIGALYQVNEKINLGFVIRDLLSPVNWDSDNDNPINKPKGKYTESIPIEVVMGSSFKLLNSLLATADYYPSIYKETSNRVRMGVEGTIMDIVSLRGGLHKYINSEDVDKYSLGIGLNLGIQNMMIHFDYAYIIDPLNNTQRFTLRAEF